MCVAFLHIANDNIANGADPAHIYQTIIKFFPLDAGVDIFFVISGFIIIHASTTLFATKTGSITFLRRRLARIVPLYWLATTAFLATLLLDHAQIHAAIGGNSFIIASYLFIPWPRPDNVMQPAYGLGWTLNYEMFFYLVFTPLITLHQRPAILAAAILLIALTTLRPILAPINPQFAYWSNPIILEFVMGMTIAQLLATGLKIPPWLRLALIIAAITAFHLNTSTTNIRPLSYGLPAAALVLAAATTPSPQTLTTGKKLLIRLGDASYAMYLVHPFVMRTCSVLWRKIHAHNEIAGTIYILAGLIMAQSIALIVNATLEKKLTLWLRRGIFWNEAV